MNDSERDDEIERRRLIHENERDAKLEQLWDAVNQVITAISTLTGVATETARQMEDIVAILEKIKATVVPEPIDPNSHDINQFPPSPWRHNI